MFRRDYGVHRFSVGLSYDSFVTQRRGAVRRAIEKREARGMGEYVWRRDWACEPLRCFVHRFVQHLDRRHTYGREMERGDEREGRRREVDLLQITIQ